MAGYRYSLALFQVNVTRKDYQTKSFGGQGKMIGSISISRKNDRFSAEGDATGGFVINENLDATGTCTINIKQFAPLVSTLTNLFNSYNDYYKDHGLAETGNTGTFKVITSELSSEGTLFDSTKIEVYYMGRLVATCEGCYLNMPEFNANEENDSRDFTFECGTVNFEALENTNNLIPVEEI